MRAFRFGRRRAEAAVAASAAALARARADRAEAARARLRAEALADPAAALARIGARPRSRLHAEAAALLTARLHGWAAALPRFARLPPGSAGATALLRSSGPALDLALPAEPRAELADAVLYTARFGDGPPPAPLFQSVPGLRCLLLTDRPLAVPGWETVRMPAPDRGELAARIRGPELLAGVEARASLYLDPGIRVVGNLGTLLTRWLAPQDLALFRHPVAQGWREAVAEALMTQPADPAALVALAEACEAAGLPEAGACDTRAIWRRHGPDALTEAWWARTTTPETADAAFAAALAATGVRPRILPASLGSLEDGVFLAHAPWPAPARSASGRPPLAFVYAEEFAATASTFLRMGQLAELVAESGYDVTWTSDFGVRDRVVLLAKGALQTRRAEEIAELRARNLAVIGSWDDLKPDAARVAALDASMAVSHRQALDLARRFSTPVFLVSHHVNRLIRPSAPPTDRLRAGYFGELANTVRPDSLAGLVELVGINTSRVETSWIERLPEFNAHWIVRKRRPFDGAKPFLKGFLAARCGAVVIASRDDEDALQYLGDDYPFFVRSLEPADLEADMVEIAAGFGGPDWRRAQAIMAEVAARSTDAVVAAEFRAMIEALT
jgi:hypothetical protein